MLECEVGSFLSSYLGLPLGGNPRVLTFQNPICEKVRWRSVAWKKGFFSKAARLTMIKFVLSGIPLSLYIVPSSVCQSIEKYMRLFCEKGWMVMDLIWLVERLWGRPVSQGGFRDW